jgi:peptide/nickel transport system permease protein
VFGKGVITMVLVFTVFGWFYPARIVRSSVLSLREKEFVEAARMVGASDLRIMRSHVLPHLVAPIVVVSTLIVAGYILAEAGPLLPGPRREVAHGQLGRSAGGRARVLHVGSVADALAGPGRLFTTLAFNLLGDGLSETRSTPARASSYAAGTGKRRSARNVPKSTRRGSRRRPRCRSSCAAESS